MNSPSVLITSVMLGIALLFASQLPARSQNAANPQNNSVQPVQAVDLSIAKLRSYGIALTPLRSGGGFANACPTKTYTPFGAGFEETPFALSISDDMLGHFKERGFSLEALCLAMRSPLLHDSATGKALPLASVSGWGLLPLNVPDCFKNGTPFLDCTINYFWQDGLKLDQGDKENFGSAAAVHDKLAAQVMKLRPGPWYYSIDVLDTQGWPWVPFDAVQRSPNLPRGYGYIFIGNQGDDPEVEKVNLQTVQKKSGLSAPWNQTQ
jgi:hypothetical protein